MKLNNHSIYFGFNNTTQVDGDGFVVDDQSKNDGRSDTFVPISRSDEFREYQFTVDNLDEFTGFTIKLVMLGTNQINHQIKELRAFAVNDKVEGHPNLYRDPKTGAIINCDDHGYSQYVICRDSTKTKRWIQNMKNDIDEIKSLLKILVEGNNKS